MTRSLLIGTIASVTFAGHAMANTPIVLNLKVKVEGAIERVDMGVWAQCTMSQRIPGGTNSRTVRTQIISPGQTFVATNGDGTVTAELLIPDDHGFELKDDSYQPRISCTLAKGTVRTDGEPIRQDELFIYGDTLMSPAGTGSCTSFDLQYQPWNNRIDDEILVCA